MTNVKGQFENKSPISHDLRFQEAQDDQAFHIACLLQPIFLATWTGQPAVLVTVPTFSWGVVLFSRERWQK
jgi:hypothetical protein